VYQKTQKKKISLSEVRSRAAAKGRFKGKAMARQRRRKRERERERTRRHTSAGGDALRPKQRLFCQKANFKKQNRKRRGFEGFQSPGVRKKKKL